MYPLASTKSHLVIEYESCSLYLKKFNIIIVQKFILNLLYARKIFIFLKCFCCFFKAILVSSVSKRFWRICRTRNLWTACWRSSPTNEGNFNKFLTINFCANYFSSLFFMESLKRFFSQHLFSHFKNKISSHLTGFIHIFCMGY